MKDQQPLKWLRVVVIGKMEERIKNIISRGYCPFFYINRDDQWCMKSGVYKDLPLIEFPRDTLLEMLDEIAANCFSYKTRINLTDIRKEILKKDGKNL